jgi:hypothetical protein
MKSNQKNLPALFAALLLAAAATLSSCRKDPQEIIALLSESEAAEIIEDAIANKTAGFTMPTVDAAAIVETYLNSCNTPGDTLLNKVKTTGLATYDYTFGMDWLVACNDLSVPQSANVDIAGNGDFSSPHWQGSQVTVGDLTFTGLGLQDPAYIVNGTYNLVGDLTGSLRKVSPSFDCTVALTLTSLTMNKTNYQITSGTGTATVTATAANGDTKTLSGTLLFNGNGSATITVNDHTHTFQWQQ